MEEIYQEQQSGDIHEFTRLEDARIQTAMAKAMELRTLHAALMNSNYTSRHLNPRFVHDSSASPVCYNSNRKTRHARQFSAQDHYPVFNPSYESEPLPGYKQILLDNPIYKETWEEHNNNADETIRLDPFEFVNFDLKAHTCPYEDKMLGQHSSANNYALTRYARSRRNSSGDVIKSVSSCNKCKPAVITSDTESLTKNNGSKPTKINILSSRNPVDSQPGHKGLSLSWLFHGLKKKNNKKKKNDKERGALSEEVSQAISMGSGYDESITTLKKELIEAYKSRDSALNQVSEMKSSVHELSQKLEYVENYCSELKKALSTRDQKPVKNPPIGEKAVKQEEMIEELLGVVSESRSSAKQFCKTLVHQMEETDNNTAMNGLHSLLQSYNLSFDSKHRKMILYHIEALVNQSLYQNFENSAFHKNGSPKYLDPREDRVHKYESFLALRNLNLNAVLRKGSKVYNAEFSKFCDGKMSDVMTTILGSTTRVWPEELVEAFLKAAKCVWLLHLLAFSFDPALGIVRVEENRTFDDRYMDDMFEEKRRSDRARRVKIMVMPGFYVHDRVVRCKVLCRYHKSVT